MLVNVERFRHRAAAAPSLSADPSPATEKISLLVPLLNDGHRVTRCALALMRQIRVPKLDIVFLDAGSDDLTRQLLLHTTAEDPRVRLLIGAPTPPGWCAYAHACEQLAVAARGTAFVFADPGLALAPGAVAAAVTALRAGSVERPGGFDLLVAEARQRTRPTADPLPRSTSARLLAVDADAYWRVGGHCTAAHDAMGEAGLVRAVRRAGGQVALADGRHAIEFLDGSAWPRERAGVAAPSTVRVRPSMSDTENSILHSFTDTARRLLAALTLAPPSPHNTPRQGHALAHRAIGRPGSGYPHAAAARVKSGIGAHASRGERAADSRVPARVGAR
jgi:hypothetical protein